MTKEEIREIWQEMKELNRMQEGEITPMPQIKEGWDKRKTELQEKYEEIETLFGHESTLSKAIIYFLSSYEKRLDELEAVEMVSPYKEPTPQKECECGHPISVHPYIPRFSSIDGHNGGCDICGCKHFHEALKLNPRKEQPKECKRCLALSSICKKCYEKIVEQPKETDMNKYEMIKKRHDKIRPILRDAEERFRISEITPEKTDWITKWLLMEIDMKPKDEERVLKFISQLLKSQESSIREEIGREFKEWWENKWKLGDENFKDIVNRITGIKV